MNEMRMSKKEGCTREMREKVGRKSGVASCV